MATPFSSPEQRHYLTALEQRLVLLEHMALTPDKGLLYWYQRDMRFLLELLSSISSKEPIRK